MRCDGGEVAHPLVSVGVEDRRHIVVLRGGDALLHHEAVVVAFLHRNDIGVALAEDIEVCRQLVEQGNRLVQIRPPIGCKSDL
ncbi:MAG: hypothetical protein AUJ92_04870 [Armatimonadetes bacterium CG2_30_59_28]|nr:MAG: hypothetical protein AUJ92_04870 [Armatimonadetes bacterium CG2_30_59_28]PIU62096.1 MAG: hypothetical protein COS85_19475 [Armatimonadetes bacterium CG07_land_8_20_14_0_80_59_28]PIX41283.1 MAG: hypothetical protein COZ56_12455 [Armatimonadetes bacterium CG_4_8_14_3_um_filter_58_9]